MSVVIKRLLVFFIGIPAVLALVLFLPYCGYLAVNVVVVFFSAMGAVEFASMLEKKNLHITKTKAFILGALAPAAMTLTISFNLPEWIIPLTVITGAGWVLLSYTFSKDEKMETVTNSIAAGFSVLIYPGFFMYWLVKMTGWGNAGVIIIFLFITFGFDSTAWLAGTLFGRNNRGIIPASPNKSIAGYVGGTVGTIIVAGGAALIYPGLFPDMPINTLLVMAVILGFCTGVAAALGDLAESAIKRSCETKDSGTLMLGRGGILDSIDSIAIAAPVFYVLFNLLFINS